MIGTIAPGMLMEGWIKLWEKKRKKHQASQTLKRQKLPNLGAT